MATESPAADNAVAALTRRRPTPQAKLRPPAPSSGYVARPALQALLECGAERKLTLVLAPAGFGKTTLVSSWLADGDRAAAWLSFDERDGDPADFVRALVEAVQAVHPDFGRTSLALLTLPELPPVGYLARTLAGELADLPDELVLVLDDYHAIDEPRVHELVAELLRQLPSNAHLVLCTRAAPPLPIPRLRVREQLVEVHTERLRFSRDEARAFLAATSPGLEHEQVAAIEARTEGWVAGLRLAALALEEQSDRVAWIRAFRGGSHRYIRDFLLGEALATQPPEVREFLSETAILDRFCADLRGALRDEPAPAGASQRIAEHLERTNLFVVPLDDEQTWYRYHHLFRDALRHDLRTRASPATIATLHRRAGAWFAGHGLIDEALRHTLDAGDDVSAAELVERNFHPELNRDAWLTVQRWLNLLPAELVERRPALLVVRAWLLSFFRHRYVASEALLRPVVDLLEGDSAGLDPAAERSLRAEIDALLSFTQWLRGDFRTAADSAQRALEHLPAAHLFVRGVAACMRALALHHLGETAAALRWLQAECEQAAPNEAARVRGLRLAQVYIALSRGDFRAAEQLAWELLAESLQHRLMDGAVWARYLLGRVFYELNDLTRARDHFLEVDRLRDQAHFLAARDGLLGLGLTEQALSGPAEAQVTLEALAEFAGAALSESDQALVRSHRARLGLLGGDLASAAAWLRSERPPASATHLVQVLESPLLTEIKVLIALATAESLAEADAKLDEAQALCEAWNDEPRLIEVQALRALLHQARADTDRALAALDEAVSRARPGGFIRTFVDHGPPLQGLLVELARRKVPPDPYVQKLLAAFPATSGPPGAMIPTRRAAQSQLIEPPTRRELEVLQLLAARLSNGEIAASLYVSSETVKKHTSNLYQKLQVSSRREAVARARALGLLGAEPWLGADAGA